MNSPVWDHTPLELWPGMSKRLGQFGVEIEMEGRGLVQKINGWHCVPDGSLRGESMEYVLRGAVSFRGLKLRLARLREVQDEVGAVLAPSHRCSTHIHVNVQNETLKTIVGCVPIFTLVEKLFFLKAQPDRYGNLFCLPNSMTGDAHVLHEQLVAFPRKLVFNRGKYAALNIDPCGQMGSIEFRVFPSTLGEEILTWATWCANVVLYARQCRDFVSAVDFARSNPSTLYSRIFGDNPLSDEDREKYEACVFESSEHAHEYAAAVDSVLELQGD